MRCRPSLASAAVSRLAARGLSFHFHQGACGVVRQFVAGIECDAMGRAAYAAVIG